MASTTAPVLFCSSPTILGTKFLASRVEVLVDRTEAPPSQMATTSGQYTYFDDPFLPKGRDGIFETIVGVEEHSNSTMPMHAFKSRLGFAIPILTEGSRDRRLTISENIVRSSESMTIRLCSLNPCCHSISSTICGPPVRVSGTNSVSQFIDVRVASDLLIERRIDAPTVIVREASVSYPSRFRSHSSVQIDLTSPSRVDR